MAAAAPASSRAERKRKARRFRRLGLTRRRAGSGMEGGPLPWLCPCLTPRMTGEAEQTRGTAGSAGSAAHSEAAPLPPHPWALPAVPALPGVGMGGEGRSRGGREPSSQGSACVRIQGACLSDRSVHRAGCGVILHGLHVNSGMQEFFLQPWWRRLIFSHCGRLCRLAMESARFADQNLDSSRRKTHSYCFVASLLEKDKKKTSMQNSNHSCSNLQGQNQGLK